MEDLLEEDLKEDARDLPLTTSVQDSPEHVDEDGVDRLRLGLRDQLVSVGALRSHQAPQVQCEDGWMYLQKPHVHDIALRCVITAPIPGGQLTMMQRQGRAREAASSPTNGESAAALGAENEVLGPPLLRTV